VSQNIQGGVARSYAKFSVEKGAFFIGHVMIVLFSIWLVFSDGIEQVGRLLGFELSFSDPDRAMILLACSVLYLLRHSLTLFYLMARKVAWSEVFGLLGFMAFFEVGFLLVGGGLFHDNLIALGWIDVIAFVLLMVGSYLNTFSELQRKWWKQNPENKGRIYTKGLFSYSMHINFFGDVVLFTCWSLFTYSLWTLVLPLMMAVMFVFFHIPALDSYLHERYGDAFLTYKATTKGFIPFVY